MSPKVLFTTEDSSTPSLWSTAYEPTPSRHISLQGNPLFTSYTPPVHVAPLFIMATNPSKINNVVYLPYFQGRLGTDSDVHVRKFEIVYAANSVPPDKIMEVFAATLQENAFLWFSREPPFGDWDALKDAFLLYFRALGFENSLMKRLRTIRMGTNETVDNYWGRMSDILMRMGAH